MFIILAENVFASALLQSAADATTQNYVARPGQPGAVVVTAERPKTQSKNEPHDLYTLTLFRLPRLMFLAAELVEHGQLGANHVDIGVRHLCEQPRVVQAARLHGPFVCIQPRSGP